MLLNPEVQKKAQEELDAVTGGDRLPTYSDMEDLPYVHALCKELVRYHPVAPIGEYLSLVLYIVPDFPRKASRTKHSRMTSSKVISFPKARW